MNDMKREIAELTVSLFPLYVDNDGGVNDAAKQILQIYSTLSKLVVLSDEIADSGNGSLLNEAVELWNTFHQERTSLQQKFGIQKPTNPGTIESKISWKKVELLSLDLRYQVASLRSQKISRNRMLGSRLSDEDSTLLAKYGQTSRSIQGEVQRLERLLEQQLEQQATQEVEQQAAHEPIQIVLDELESPIVEPICTHCNDLQQKVDSANARLEVYEMEKAMDLVKAGNHGDAAAIFEGLYRVRDDETQRKWRSRDEAGADNAEKAALEIKYEWAKALVELNSKEDAQNMMRRVLDRRELLFGPDSREARSAQWQLCRIFRSRQNYRAAERMYRKVWDERDPRFPDSWVMENGRELAMVLAEQKYIPEAEQQFKRVLAAFGDDHQASSETMLQYALIMSKSHESSKAASALQPFMFLEGVDLSPELLACATNVGESLFEEKKWAEAEPILAKVRQERKKTLPADSPEILRVTGLLAWTYRHLQKFDHAYNRAQEVWDKGRETPILRPSLSPGVNMIWLLWKRGGRDDLQKARSIWGEVLQSRQVGSADEARETAESWRLLAHDMKKFSNKRHGSVKTTTADKIRSEAEELQRRFG